jgi:hypothetical protein
MERSIVWLVLLVAACAEKPKTTTAPPAPTNDEHVMTLVVDRCMPVGYGEHCGGTIGGRAVSIQACVGNDAIDDLMGRLERAPIAGQDGGQPVTIALETRYVGVLDAAYSSDVCGGLLFEDSKEQFHVLKVLSTGLR